MNFWNKESSNLVLANSAWHCEKCNIHVGFCLNIPCFDMSTKMVECLLRSYPCCFLSWSELDLLDTFASYLDKEMSFQALFCSSNLIVQSLRWIYTVSSQTNCLNLLSRNMLSEHFERAIAVQWRHLWWTSQLTIRFVMKATHLRTVTLLFSPFHIFNSVKIQFKKASKMNLR